MNSKLTYPATYRDLPYTDAQYITPSYEKVNLESSIEIDTLKNTSILECQGDFILIPQHKPVTESMIVFQAIKSFCNEILVEMQEEEYCLCLYKTEKEGVIRPKRVFFLELPEVTHTDIVLQTEYRHIVSDFSQDIQIYITNFLKTYTPSKKVALEGAAPLALMLALQHSLQGLCTELWHNNIQIY